ncbi:MAG TPA: NAD-dependent epimerase/dehydratase family protein [Streptosporangiaceae bacterium]|nr:NAD-dependent epimerase/dehydratase family protein [Streptosporangiaceae bacterium]
MRLLVLGGTRFLGRAIVDEALGRGHDVTTFTRGRSGHARPGVQALHGDRTVPAELWPLSQQEWDAVIDTSVLAPSHVAAGLRALQGRVGHYTYVSTLSVYEDLGREPVNEDSTVLACPSDATGTMETLGYGELKAGSERAVMAAMPGHSLIVRPGVIVGPHENIGRLPWWLCRLAQGGEVVAPGAPERPAPVTDARDLAVWLVDNTRRGIPGAVNVPGPQTATMGGLLAACAEATSADRATGLELHWVSDADLEAAGVEPWTELPLWIPDNLEWAGLWQVSGDRALRTGLHYRPITDTAHDTWQWLKQEASATGRPVTEFQRMPGLGLDPGRERNVLERVTS